MGEVGEVVETATVRRNIVPTKGPKIDLPLDASSARTRILLLSTSAPSVRPSRLLVNLWTPRCFLVILRRCLDKPWLPLLLNPRPRRLPLVWLVALVSKSLKCTSKRCSSVISTRFLVNLFMSLLVFPPKLMCPLVRSTKLPDKSERWSRLRPRSVTLRPSWALPLPPPNTRLMLRVWTLVLSLLVPRRSAKLWRHTLLLATSTVLTI